MDYYSTIKRNEIGSFVEIQMDLESVMGFPGSSPLKYLLAMQETLVQFLGQEDPLEKG